MTYAVGKLPLRALPGRGYGKTHWYRAVRLKYVRYPLAWQHTWSNTTRFKREDAHYPLLYLAPDPFTARLEVGCLLGHPRRGPVRRGPCGWSVVGVTVRLHRVADFRVPGGRSMVTTTVQELTGDWFDYDRTAASPDVVCNPPAPTQRLGEALYRSTSCQGFLTPSARNPVLPNLVVFPDRVSIDPRALTIEP